MLFPHYFVIFSYINEHLLSAHLGFISCHCSILQLQEVCVIFPLVNSEEIKIQKSQGQSMLSDPKHPGLTRAGGHQHNDIVNTYIYKSVQSSFAECCHSHKQRGNAGEE
jgi:hypothetical protein